MNMRLLSVLLLLFCCFSLRAQQIQVSGIVRDSEGKPLKDVTVVVRDDTTTRSKTDPNGLFNLKARAKDILRFSLQGKQSQSQPASSMFMTVILTSTGKTNAPKQDVGLGIMTSDRKLVAGSVNELPGDSVKIDGVADVSHALDGKVAGVASNVSSSPSGTAHTTIRGSTSIYGESKPLWVLDGVILDEEIDINPENLASADAKMQIASAIGGLNASDIESFKVLKDASTTSIYGPRAVGGVIVVTTRKGGTGSNSISYTGEFTLRPIPSYRDLNIINSQGHMSILMDMYNGGHLEIYKLNVAKQSGAFGRMYEMLNEQDAQGNFLLPNTIEAKQAYLERAERQNTNWFTELYQPSILQNHSVSLTTGGERANYYASVSALIDPGWAKYSNESRYTANLNANYQILRTLKLNIITNGSYRSQHTAGTVKPYSYITHTGRTLDPNETYIRQYAPFNIHNELQNNYADINVADVKLQANLSWKPIKQIEANILGAIRYQGTNQKTTITEQSNEAMAYRAQKTRVIQNNNTFMYKDPFDPYAQPITVLPEGGLADLMNSSLISKDFRATLRYNDSFNQGMHHLQLFGGMEVNEAQRTRDTNKEYGLIYSLGRLIYMDPLAFEKLANENKNYYSDSITLSRNVSFFGNLSYSFKERYTLNGTLRFDGTNKFGVSPLSRWLPTWNVAFSWDVAQEKFFRYLSPLSSLQFKVSYGITADSPYSSNSYNIIRGHIPWRPSRSSRESALSIIEPTNHDLTYEKKQELNLGMNTSVLNGRIGVGLEVYQRNNDDLIGKINTQGTSGFITRYGNVASMESSGVELSLTTQNIKTKSFSWNTTFIYSKNRNKITKLFSNAPVSEIITGSGFAKEGYPVASLFSIPFHGLTNEGLPSFRSADGSITIDGIRFDDRSHTEYLKYEGTTRPTDIGSLSNLFKYKGLTLNVFITYSFGNVLRLNPNFDSTYDDVETLGHEFKNRWVKPGDELTTNIPAIPTNEQIERMPNIKQAYRAYNYSDVRVAKGDFIRMKEISLAYEFDKKFAQKLGLKRVGLKLQASNLFLLYADSKLNGADPEYGVKANVPLPRQFTFTLRLGL